jgi:hypothetical protein
MDAVYLRILQDLLAPYLCGRYGQSAIARFLLNESRYIFKSNRPATKWWGPIAAFTGGGGGAATADIHDTGARMASWAMA